MNQSTSVDSLEPRRRSRPGARALWRVSATSADTYAVFFAGPDSTQLCALTATPTGTYRLRTLVRHPQDRPPQAVGHSVYFLNTTPAAGQELWATDGSVQGTHIVADILRGNQGSRRSHRRVCGEAALLLRRRW